VISVFIPAFNEAANLAATVETVTAAATQAGCAGLQIIIVNDGSRLGDRDLRPFSHRSGR